MPGSLLLAIGNPLRRDDGIAHRVLEILGPLPASVARSVHQLTPELADQIAAADLVVFIDADVTPGEARLESLPRDAPAAPLAHALAPAEVVALARTLYGFNGRAYLCRVPGADFTQGGGISDEAEGNAWKASDLIAKLLDAG